MIAALIMQVHLQNDRGPDHDRDDYVETFRDITLQRGVTSTARHSVNITCRGVTSPARHAARSHSFVYISTS